MRLVVALLALAAWASPAAQAFPRPAPGELTLRMDDGVTLACGFQHAEQPFLIPAVILFHGLGGKHQDLDGITRTFNGSGYATLACDARGQGGSGGFFDLDGPRTVADVRQQVEWLASIPGIDRGRIGAWGISLGGGAVLNSTVAGVPWAAVEVVETWSDLYRALVPNDLPKAGAIFLFSRGIPDRAYSPELRALVQDALAARNLRGIRGFLAPRSSLAGLGRVTTPTYLFQGRKDFAFDIEEAMSAYRALAGPKRLYVGAFGHSPSTFPGPDLPHVLSEAVGWFDRYLKGSAPTGVPAAVQLAPEPWQGQPVALPPARTLRLSLRGTSTIGSAGKVVRTVRLPARALETFGAPVIRARLSGSFTHIVAVLEAGNTIVSDGGAAVRLGATPRSVTFRLISDAVRIPKGARLRLTLAATSTAQSSSNLLYPGGVPAGLRLRVGTVQVALPVLTKPVSE
jgi:pimeloyl-ACP methyl ester carboxylesterase